MKVQIDKSYPMPCAPEVAWAFLQDLESVAGCMPGAKITEKLDGGRYKGTVTSKLGPASMTFRGEVELKNVDGAARSLTLVGKGTDSTGSSGASMNLNARVDAADAGLCSLVGQAEVAMSGKAVAFGGRMMNAVADQILRQFADNFANRVGAIQAQGAVVAPTAHADAAAPAAGAAPPPPAGAPANELNGLALLWAVLRDWLRGAFGKRPV
jgi:carbon monoxide dehydrogenase subunit G